MWMFILLIACMVVPKVVMEVLKEYFKCRNREKRNCYAIPRGYYDYPKYRMSHHEIRENLLSIIKCFDSDKCDYFKGKFAATVSNYYDFGLISRCSYRTIMKHLALNDVKSLQHFIRTL